MLQFFNSQKRLNYTQKYDLRFGRRFAGEVIQAKTLFLGFSLFTNLLA